jgi:hypothetical protein
MYFTLKEIKEKEEPGLRVKLVGRIKQIGSEGDKAEAYHG